MEKFRVEKKVIFVITTVDGEFTFNSHKELEQYCENIIGAMADRISAGNTGHPIKDAQRVCEFLENNGEDIKTLYAMLEAVKELKAPPAKDHDDCDDFYCTRCGSSSGIQYVGDE